jgi:predicted DNA-binding transcriptional regulator AlpA
MTTLPTFLRFADLRAAKIVRNETTLQRLIETQGFPPGRKLGANTRAWTTDEIQNWLDSRPTAKKQVTRRKEQTPEVQDELAPEVQE